eukprot:5353077-Lingulodinium_polyedra.AAC.1
MLAQLPCGGHCQCEPGGGPLLIARVLGAPRVTRSFGLVKFVASGFCCQIVGRWCGRVAMPRK